MGAGPKEGWIVLSRELIADVLDLLGAEIEDAQQELGGAFQGLAKAAALLVGALMLAFWVVALVAATLIVVLSIWLPPWASALIVTIVVLLTTGLLAWLGLRKLGAQPNPVEIVMRRVRNHLAWWRDEASTLPRIDQVQEATPAAQAALETEKPVKNPKVVSALDDERRREGDEE